MGLRFKILSGFLWLILILLAAGGISIYEFSAMGASVQRILDENYKSINAAKTMIEALERQDSAVLLLLSGKWEQGRQTIEQAKERFDQGFAIARNNLTIQGESAVIDRISQKYQRYKALWERPIVDTPKAGDLNWYFEIVHQAFQEVKAAVNDLKDLNDQALYQTASQLQNRSHQAMMPLIVAIVAALLFTFLFNFFIHRYVVDPIIRITQAIQEYNAHDTSLDIRIENRDELADLLTSLREALTRHRRLPRDLE